MPYRNTSNNSPLAHTLEIKIAQYSNMLSLMNSRLSEIAVLHIGNTRISKKIHYFKNLIITNSKTADYFAYMVDKQEMSFVHKMILNRKSTELPSSSCCPSLQEEIEDFGKTLGQINSEYNKFLSKYL